MRTSSALWFWTASWLSLAGCAPIEDDEGEAIATHVDHDAPRIVKAPGRSMLRPTTASTDRLASFTASGAVALLDLDGSERARSEPLGAQGPVDLTFDAVDRALVAFAAGPDDEGGRLLRMTIPGDAASLGAPAEGAWIDGIARLDALSVGMVTFEQNIGARWKLAPRSGGASPSVACPRPASVQLVDGPSPTLVALSSPEPETDHPSLLEVAVHSTGLGPCVRHELEGAPASARLAVLGDGRRVVAGVAGGHLVLHFVEDGELTVATDTGTLAGSVEALLALPGRPHGALALTRDPSALVVVDASGAPGSASWQWASASIPGEVPPEWRFFSRALAVHADRAFVATTSGVVAFSIAGDPAPPAIASAVFAALPNDYRAPLAMVPSSPP